MKAKKIVAICAGVAAVLAIVIGLCCFFFATKSIRQIPGFLKIEQVDQDYFLVTEYGGDLKYQFKLEQKIDEEFLYLKTVESDTNALKLSDCGIDIIAGAKYRFSVCYCNENVSGEFSKDVIEWQPSWTLRNVDYSTVVRQDLFLTWDEVFHAEGYVLKFVKDDGSVFTETVPENLFSFENVERGKYRVYIVATSTNSYIESSAPGIGFDLTVERENVIISATLSDEKILSVNCTEQVDFFELYVDDILKATLKAKDQTQSNEGYVYVFDDTKLLLGNYDVEDVKIEIKSCSGSFLKESDLKEVEK